MMEIREIPATMGRKAETVVFCNGHKCPLSNLAALADAYDARISQDIHIAEDAARAEKAAKRQAHFDAFCETNKIAIAKIMEEFAGYSVLFDDYAYTATAYSDGRRTVYIHAIAGDTYKIDYHASYDF